MKTFEIASRALDLLERLKKWDDQIYADYNRLACDAHFHGDKSAGKALHQVRVALEMTELRRIVNNEVHLSSYPRTDWVTRYLGMGDVFGQSSKQGVSLRMPLSSCTPTRLCMEKCYAHDGKDPLEPAVRRGVINGMIAFWYESTYSSLKKKMLDLLRPHVERAIYMSFDDAQKAKGWGYERRPRIRFSHVGDIAEYPLFANDTAKLIWDVSRGQVDIGVYTRHRNAYRLDPSLMTINFSTDPSTPSSALVPDRANLTYACFDGKTREDAHVNFAEHHGGKRIRPAGKGFVCPSTLPGRPHGCDANRCDRCFSRTS